jgi:hypothetical protein
MPQTHTEHYERADGRAIELTYAAPGNVVRGGLVVLHEADRVTDGARLLYRRPGGGRMAHRRAAGDRETIP